MNHNKLTLIIFFIAYPIYLDISIEEDVNLIAAIVTKKLPSFLEKTGVLWIFFEEIDKLLKMFILIVILQIIFLYYGE